MLLFLGRLCGEDLATLTRIIDVRNLRNNQAAQSIPVKLQATVLYYSSRPTHELFIYDGEAGIYVNFTGNSLDLVPGQRVELSGQSMTGTIAPMIKCTKVIKVGTDPLPGERMASIRDLLSGKEDCNWVAVEGMVREDIVLDDHREMVLDVEGRRVPLYLAGTFKALNPFTGLMGAKIVVRCVVAGNFNKDAQIQGIHLFTPSLECVRVVNPPPVDIFDLPLKKFGDLKASINLFGKPAKVVGTVTYDHPGYTLCLTDGKAGLMVKTRRPEQVPVGEVVEVVGFPAQGVYSVYLDDSLFRQDSPGSLPEVTDLTAEQASTGSHDAELVRIEAKLSDQRLVNTEQVLLLDSSDTLFAARLPSILGRLDGQFHKGDTLQITGICKREQLLGNIAPPGRQMFNFELLLRSPQDVGIVQWWNNRRVFTLLAVTVVIFTLAFLWIFFLRRHIRMQKAIIEHQVRHAATLEERNRIARELHDTLAQGFAGTAFVLEGIVTKLQNTDNQLKPHIDLALRMVRHGIMEARLSLMNLRVDAGEDRDLATTLEEAARELVSHSTAALTIDIKPPVEPLTPNLKSNLLRISVEAIINSLRHGKPQTIDISLTSTESVCTLRICDDGLGFDPQSVQLKEGHFGILGMQERARQMKATLRSRAIITVAFMERLSSSIGDGFGVW